MLFSILRAFALLLMNSTSKYRRCDVNRKELEEEAFIQGAVYGKTVIKYRLTPNTSLCFAIF